MSIYAIGDLHLSFDERIQKPMDIFGRHWENHYEKVEDAWTDMISEEDTVIIAGDVSWGLKLDEAMADLVWISKLPGKKVIIKGNHDLWWTSISKLNKLDENMFFLQNSCFEVDEKTGICGSRGWICPGTEGFDSHDNKIFNRELIRLEMSLKEAKAKGKENIIVALHYPPTNDKMQDSEFTKLLTEYGVSTCVYGHLHGKEAFKKGIKGRLNGVEYKLVSLDFLDGKPELVR